MAFRSAFGNVLNCETIFGLQFNSFSKIFVWRCFFLLLSFLRIRYLFVWNLFFLLCIAIIPIEIVNLQSRCIKCGSFIMPKQIAGIAATDTNNFNIQCACNRTPPKLNNLQLNFECYVRLYSFSNSLNLSAFVVVVGFRVL